MQIKRGDIWYIDRGINSGSEQRAGRPAVVVSNDKNNQFSPTIEVVYLTTQPKKDLPTHVLITNGGRESTVLCEQVTTVAVERLTTYRGRVSEEEMRAIEEAILVSLDLPIDAEVTDDSPPALEHRLMRVEVECGVLRKMYGELLDRIVGT